MANKASDAFIQFESQFISHWQAAMALNKVLCHVFWELWNNKNVGFYKTCVPSSHAQAPDQYQLYQTPLGMMELSRSFDNISTIDIHSFIIIGYHNDWVLFSPSMHNILMSDESIDHWSLLKWMLELNHHISMDL